MTQGGFLPEAARPCEHNKSVRKMKKNMGETGSELDWVFSHN
jgi:hypothetical protein